MQSFKDYSAKNFKPRTDTSHYPPVQEAPAPQRVTLSQLQNIHPKVTEAKQAAQQWAANKQAGHLDSSLILFGPNGIGKTHIALSILWSMCYQVDGQTVAPIGKFFLSDDLLARLDADDDPTNLSSNLARLIPNNSMIDPTIQPCPIIVIDDIGAERDIQYSKDQEKARHVRFFRVIDYCYKKQISVIITSNLSLDGLKAHLGPRSWDRLLQMAPRGQMVDMSGVTSWRKRSGGR